jgi:hypothetical protein
VAAGHYSFPFLYQLPVVCKEEKKKKYMEKRIERGKIERRVSNTY